MFSMFCRCSIKRINRIAIMTVKLGKFISLEPSDKKFPKNMDEPVKYI